MNQAVAELFSRIRRFQSCIDEDEKASGKTLMVCSQEKVPSATRKISVSMERVDVHAVINSFPERTDNECNRHENCSVPHGKTQTPLNFLL